jgi:hypothetical protein
MIYNIQDTSTKWLFQTLWRAGLLARPQSGLAEAEEEAAVAAVVVAVEMEVVEVAAVMTLTSS